MPNELVETAKLMFSDAKEGAAEVYETGKTIAGIARHGVFSRYTYDKVTGYIGKVIEEEWPMMKEEFMSGMSDMTSEMARLPTGGIPFYGGGISGEEMMDAGRSALGFEVVEDDFGSVLARPQEVTAAKARMKLTSLRAKGEVVPDTLRVQAGELPPPEMPSYEPSSAGGGYGQFQGTTNHRGQRTPRATHG